MSISSVHCAFTSSLTPTLLISFLSPHFALFVVYLVHNRRTETSEPRPVLPEQGPQQFPQFQSNRNRCVRPRGENFSPSHFRRFSIWTSLGHEAKLFHLFLAKTMLILSPASRTSTFATSLAPIHLSTHKNVHGPTLFVVLEVRQMENLSSYNIIIPCIVNEKPPASVD